MASVLRKLRFKKSEPRESEARIKLQKELFEFNKCTEHGFPHKPTALAYDPKLKLLAIGTKYGSLRIFGKPGVEFSAEHPEEEPVTKIFFLPGQARLITLCNNNSVYLWEVNISDDSNGVLEQIRSFSMEASKLKPISTCCVADGQLLMGTEGGNIHTLDTNSFVLSEHIIYQDVVMQNVPDDFKVNPGAVEAIAQSPTDPTKFLIGYNRGLIVLWNTKESSAEQTFNASQQLESVSWYRNGKEFMSAHADGSYIVWLASDSTKPKEKAHAPYGPFNCKGITKISWKSAKPDPFVLFAGGMPRAAYGDYHTVSVMQGVQPEGQHVVFNFTSRVVDFIPLCSSEEHDNIENFDYDDPHTLLVLAEEELVAIDLQTDSWPTFRPPYLCSLHSSAITAITHASNVPDALWNKIRDVGNQQQSAASTRQWPIGGGQIKHGTDSERDMLISGHEDGSIRFWDASSTDLQLMYKLSTAPVFVTDGAPDASTPESEQEQWPPFRNVGTFDPYSDDPRLAIQKVMLCSLSETLVFGGTAGQVVVLSFERDSREQEVKITPLNLISDRDNYSWKGHKALPVNEGDVRFAAGFQPVCVVQLQPPAAVTSIEVQAEWQLVAAGTAHGYGLCDYAQKKDVYSKCTLSPQDLSGTGESQMSRRKSFKKSLRESFRRLRTRRSQRANAAAAAAAAKRKADSPKKEAPKKEAPAPTPAAETPAAAEETETKTEGENVATAEEGATAAAPAEAAASETPESPAKEEPKTTIEVVSESPRPVERQVESRQVNKDEVASMVRVIVFADTFLLNGQNHGPVMFVGTNLGTIYAHEIAMPASDKRDTDAITCTLRKELQLQHRAPVVHMTVVDRHAQPLPGPLEVTNGRAKAPDMGSGQQLVVVSEEQFKIFNLPSLKANNKYKLTAHEGAKVRRVGMVGFRSKSDERYIENDLAVLTNLGDVHVFSVPQLRRQIKADCVRKDNVSGIVCSLFTQTGQGFYLGSPSEFVRFSVSARFVTKPACTVEIADGARPPPPVEPETPAEETDKTEVTVTESAPAEGEEADEKPADQSALESANNSVVADTTIDSANITADSIHLHNVSESHSEQRVESGNSSVVESSQVITSTRTFSKRTVIESTTMGSSDGETKRTETVTIQQSASGPAGDSATTTTTTTTETSGGDSGAITGGGGGEE